MDDKEKKVSDGNGDYREEMEELARIFKEELGKAVQDAEDAAVIDSLDNIEVEGYDPKSLSLDESKTPTEPEELCECCGERPRGTEKNPDGPFCQECEAILEKYPYDWKGVVALVAVICVCVGALAFFVFDTPLFATMKQGDKAFGESKLITAMTKYQKASSFLPEGKEDKFLNLHAKRIMAEYKLLNMDMAISDSEKYFTDKTLKLPMFNKVEGIGEEMDSMWASAAAIQKALGDESKITKETYDETIKKLDSLSGKKIYEKNGEVTDELDTSFTPDGTENVYIYDEGWLNIYKYSAAMLCEREKTELVGYLEKAKGSSDYIGRLVAPLLASTYVGIGEYDKAEAMLDEIRNYNAEGTEYYLISAMLYRYRDKDYQKGFDVCIEGLNSIAALPGGSDLIPQIGYTLSMQKTLNLIMLKDYAGAYKSAKECYSYQAETYSLSVQVRDLKAILALATNDTEGFKELEDEIKQYPDEGIEFSQDVTDYKEGKITLEQIAESGRYDII